MARFKNIDRNTPMLLPYDIRDWVSENDFVHFVIGVVSQFDLSRIKVNTRGSGSREYPPDMMLTLLLYSYSSAIYSSRSIEKQTYSNLNYRYICANTHPDHDTICKFRRENLEVISFYFVELLEIAKEMGALKVGTISVDGSHIKANANRDKNITYERALELESLLEEEVQNRLSNAEKIDHSEKDEEDFPVKISAIESKVKLAKKALEDRRKKKRDEVILRAERVKKEIGSKSTPKIPSETPDKTDQINDTDPDSRIMRKTRSRPCEQAYNAQISVDSDGSLLVLGGHISQNTGDTYELIQAVDEVTNNIGKPKRVLADSGYLTIIGIKDLIRRNISPFIATSAGKPPEEDFDLYNIKKKPTTGNKYTNHILVHQVKKMHLPKSKTIYSKRMGTVEPVFGFIKQQMKFRQFNLRGLKKVSGEWKLLLLAYNMKRLWQIT